MEEESLDELEQSVLSLCHDNTNDENSSPSSMSLTLSPSNMSLNLSPIKDSEKETDELLTELNTLLAEPVYSVSLADSMTPFKVTPFNSSTKAQSIKPFTSQTPTYKWSALNFDLKGRCTSTPMLNKGQSLLKTDENQDINRNCSISTRAAKLQQPKHLADVEEESFDELLAEISSLCDIALPETSPVPVTHHERVSSIDLHSILDDTLSKSMAKTESNMPEGNGRFKNVTLSVSKCADLVPEETEDLLGLDDLLLDLDSSYDDDEDVDNNTVIANETLLSGNEKALCAVMDGQRRKNSPESGTSVVNQVKGNNPLQTSHSNIADISSSYDAYHDNKAVNRESCADRNNFVGVDNIQYCDRELQETLISCKQTVDQSGKCDKSLSCSEKQEEKTLKRKIVDPCEGHNKVIKLEEETVVKCKQHDGEGEQKAIESTQQNDLCDNMALGGQRSCEKDHNGNVAPEEDSLATDKVKTTLLLATDSIKTDTDDVNVHTKTDQNANYLQPSDKPIPVEQQNKPPQSLDPREEREITTRKWGTKQIQNPDTNLTFSSRLRARGNFRGSCLEGKHLSSLMKCNKNETDSWQQARTRESELYHQRNDILLWFKMHVQDTMEMFRQEEEELREEFVHKESHLRLLQEQEKDRLMCSLWTSHLLDYRLQQMSHDHQYQLDCLWHAQREKTQNMRKYYHNSIDQLKEQSYFRCQTIDKMIRQLQYGIREGHPEYGPKVMARLVKGPCRANGQNFSVVNMLMPADVAAAIMREDHVYALYYKHK